MLEDGTCTVIFEDNFGHNNEISQVSQLKPYDPEAVANLKRGIPSKATPLGANGKAMSKKELETKLKEKRKEKKEKFQEKIKIQEQISEKSKNNWKDFNSKVSLKNQIVS